MKVKPRDVFISVLYCTEAHSMIATKSDADGMLLIVWISAPGPPGCCPLSPAKSSAG